MDGIQAQLCFPSFPGFAGSTFFNAKDKELAAACVTAYNDWMIDEWCAANPTRQIPLCLVPFWDIEATAAEAERVAAKGAKAITFTEMPHALGLPSFHTDALGSASSPSARTLACPSACISAPAGPRPSRRRPRSPPRSPCSDSTARCARSTCSTPGSSTVFPG